MLLLLLLFVCLCTVKEHLTVHYAEYYADVFPVAFGMPLPPAAAPAVSSPHQQQQQQQAKPVSPAAPTPSIDPLVHHGTEPAGPD